MEADAEPDARCDECRAPVPADARRCAMCGTRLRSRPLPTGWAAVRSRECPCGTTATGRCAGCGTKVCADHARLVDELLTCAACEERRAAWAIRRAELLDNAVRSAVEARARVDAAVVADGLGDMSAFVLRVRAMLTEQDLVHFRLHAVHRPGTRPPEFLTWGYPVSEQAGRALVLTVNAELVVVREERGRYVFDDTATEPWSPTPDEVAAFLAQARTIEEWLPANVRARVGAAVPVAESTPAAEPPVAEPPAGVPGEDPAAAGVASPPAPGS